MSIDPADQCLRSNYGYGRNLNSRQDQAQEFGVEGRRSGTGPA